jgi:hypothetical protein
VHCAADFVRAHCHATETFLDLHEARKAAAQSTISPSNSMAASDENNVEDNHDDSHDSTDIDSHDRTITNTYNVQHGASDEMMQGLLNLVGRQSDTIQQGSNYLASSMTSMMGSMGQMMQSFMQTMMMSMSGGMFGQMGSRMPSLGFERGGHHHHHHS